MIIIKFNRHAVNNITIGKNLFIIISQLISDTHFHNNLPKFIKTKKCDAHQHFKKTIHYLCKIYINCFTRLKILDSINHIKELHSISALQRYSLLSLLLMDTSKQGLLA